MVANYNQIELVEEWLERKYQKKYPQLKIGSRAGYARPEIFTNLCEFDLTKIDPSFAEELRSKYLNNERSNGPEDYFPENLSCNENNFLFEIAISKDYFNEHYHFTYLEVMCRILNSIENNKIGVSSSFEKEDLISKFYGNLDLKSITQYVFHNVFSDLYRDARKQKQYEDLYKRPYIENSYERYLEIMFLKHYCCLGNDYKNYMNEAP